MPRRSISWCEWREHGRWSRRSWRWRPRLPPAAAAGDNAAPRIVRAEASAARGSASCSVVVVGRDRDDVVRGAEVSWGEESPTQGMSACEESSGSRLAPSAAGAGARSGSS